MRLHWYTSFNPQKVRFALGELGCDYKLEVVHLFKEEQKRLKPINPCCKVPVLEDGDFALWESNAILAYLGERESKLWPQDPRERATALQWLFYEAASLTPHIGNYWFYEVIGPEADIPRDEAALASAAKTLPKRLAIVSDHLKEQSWMLNDFGLVDCCYGTVLHALAASTFDLSSYAPITAYLERIRDRAAFKACEFPY